MRLGVNEAAMAPLSFPIPQDQRRFGQRQDIWYDAYTLSCHKAVTALEFTILHRRPDHAKIKSLFWHLMWDFFAARLTAWTMQQVVRCLNTPFL
jgi:hypothetical protein